MNGYTLHCELLLLRQSLSTSLPPCYNLLYSRLISKPFSLSISTNHQNANMSAAASASAAAAAVPAPVIDFAAAAVAKREELARGLIPLPSKVYPARVIDVTDQLKSWKGILSVDGMELTHERLFVERDDNGDAVTLAFTPNKHAFLRDAEFDLHPVALTLSPMLRICDTPTTDRYAGPFKDSYADTSDQARSYTNKVHKAILSHYLSMSQRTLINHAIVYMNRRAIMESAEPSKIMDVFYLGLLYNVSASVNGGSEGRKYLLLMNAARAVGLLAVHHKIRSQVDPIMFDGKLIMEEFKIRPDGFLFLDFLPKASPHAWVPKDQADAFTGPPAPSAAVATRKSVFDLVDFKIAVLSWILMTKDKPTFTNKLPDPLPPSKVLELPMVVTIGHPVADAKKYNQLFTVGDDVKPGTLAVPVAIGKPFTRIVYIGPPMAEVARLRGHVLMEGEVETYMLRVLRNMDSVDPTRRIMIKWYNDFKASDEYAFTVERAIRFNAVMLGFIKHVTVKMNQSSQTAELLNMIADWRQKARQTLVEKTSAPADHVDHKHQTNGGSASASAAAAAPAAAAVAPRPVTPPVPAVASAPPPVPVVTALIPAAPVVHSAAAAAVVSGPVGPASESDMPPDDMPDEPMTPSQPIPSPKKRKAAEAQSEPESKHEKPPVAVVDADGDHKMQDVASAVSQASMARESSAHSQSDGMEPPPAKKPRTDAVAEGASSAPTVQLAARPNTPIVDLTGSETPVSRVGSSSLMNYLFHSVPRAASAPTPAVTAAIAAAVAYSAVDVASSAAAMVAAAKAVVAAPAAAPAPVSVASSGSQSNGEPFPVFVPPPPPHPLSSALSVPVVAAAAAAPVAVPAAAAGSASASASVAMEVDAHGGDNRVPPPDSPLPLGGGWEPPTIATLMEQISSLHRKMDSMLDMMIHRR